jgi:catechol 2,3-dioxygenase-like lactoylglutathione lyase family enzyme/GNAT superfamily N-acetyltransferase
MALELNHLTFSVRDLQRSIRFYVDIVGLRLEASWDRGAYLTAGSAWICLSLDENTRTQPMAEYTHFAFGCAAEVFEPRANRIRGSGARIWKDNRSEGDSLYFLDPDGHKLELHIGNLKTRLDACRIEPYDGMTFHATAEPLATLSDGLTISLDASPGAQDCASVIDGLVHHTERESQIQRRDGKPLSVFIRDSQQAVVAGLNGVTIWGWLHIKELWVRAELRRRGLGSQLMSAAEREAVRRGCRHAFLDTFDFQAKPFYERSGYQQWGELEDFPPGHTRFFMRKTLPPG